MKTLRQWATPLTIGSFLLMAVTGILMFFHLDSGLNKLAHEWLGWAMVAAVAAHLVVNSRAFTLHFRKPAGRAAIGAFVAVLALSFLPLGGESNDGRRLMLQAAGNARIETLVEMSGAPLEAALNRLSEGGFTVQPGQTLSEAAGGDRGRQSEILGVIFGS